MLVAAPAFVLLAAIGLSGLLSTYAKDARTVFVPPKAEAPVTEKVRYKSQSRRIAYGASYVAKQAPMQKV